MMRVLPCGYFRVIFLLVAAGCGPGAPKQGLDGTWAGVSLVTREGKQDDAFARTIRWTIAGDTIAATDQRIQEAARGTIKVDDTKRPQTFDAVGKPGGGSFAWSGIYDLEGDTLKVCYVLTNTGDKRPKEFKAKPAFLLVLKRIN
jgi:uncharacterized protein (TIGR03067 family)